MSLCSCLVSSFAPSLPLGERRGVADLARFALDLSRDRAEPERILSARGDYPSPPMSGSPLNPPKTSIEAGDQIQGAYQQQRQEQQQQSHQHHPHQPGSYDAFGVVPPAQRFDVREQYQSSGQSHGSETPSQLFSRRQDSTPRSGTVPFPPPSAMPQPLEPPQQTRQLQPTQTTPYLPAPTQPIGHSQGVLSSAPPGQSAFTMPNQPTAQDNPPYTSPKTQRKTKGHVASACVPCKKAHLRCDSQRPCGRCLTGGKEDACVDVQHKKRGRPRLRDDKDSRFDPRYPNQPEMMRRAPMALYSVPPMGSAVDDPLRRGQSSYRVLKSQPTESIQPRYLDRASTSDANIFPPRLSISTSAPEPVAFLTTDFVIKSASTAFSDAIGVPLVEGRELLDLVSAKDKEKVKQFRQDIKEEQRKRDPNYLPPIYLRQQEDQVIKALAFTPEHISKFVLDRSDTLIFQAPDGQQRSYAVRIGLAKRLSIYFIVLLLNASAQVPPSHPYLSPSSQPSSAPYSYQPPHQALQHPTPVSASFDTTRSRYGEGSYGPDPSPSPRQQGPMMSGLSPGMPPFGSRPENPPSYQIPRSELAPLTGNPSQQAGYRQLPPILGQPRPSPSQPPPSPWPWDERIGSIGGNTEKPEIDPRR